MPGQRARASQVLIPHECVSVKNATACHRHGDGVSSSATAAKNASISPLVSGRDTRHESGFPLIRQHVSAGIPVRAQPPAEVTEIRHPRPVTARGGSCTVTQP